MKVKLLSTLFLISYQFSFSQTEKPIKGRVLNQNLLLKNVSVINKTTKKSTLTDEKGEFVIDAKVNDSLIFYSKEYYFQRLKLSSNQIDQNNLTVNMFLKPEELEEVVITKMKSIELSKDKAYEQQKSQEVALSRAASRPQTGVYDGTITNGANLMAIGGLLLKLFKKEKEEEKEPPPKVEFAALARSICNEKFYLETLKLEPDQIALFLQFCDADPKSKKITEQHNILSMMDFLMSKNLEFKNNLATLK